jgi:hypothetical protein
MDGAPTNLMKARPRTLRLSTRVVLGSSADAIRTRIVADFTRLKLALPDARFIVVEPFWFADVRPPSVDIIGGWVEAAATQRCRLRRNRLANGYGTQGIRSLNGLTGCHHLP